MASDEWLKKRYKMEAMVQHQVSQHASPYIPQERPREGVGGTDAHPFDDFGNDRNPPVINPATGKPEWAGTNQGTDVAGNPSFDINETPATRRTRKIRTLQERGVGGEKGNAGDILKKGIQLPNIQANVDYGTPSELDKWLQLYQRNSGSLRHLDPDLRKLILQRGAMKAELPANNIRRLQDSGHTTVPDPENPGRLKIIDSLGPQPPQA